MSEKVINMKIRKIGRMFPIEPRPDDEEAIEYLDSLVFALQELREEEDFDENYDDLVLEYAEGTVPYNNYKAVNAYAQLGLYEYDPVDAGFDPAVLDGDEILTIIRGTLYSKSRDILESDQVYYTIVKRI